MVATATSSGRRRMVQSCQLFSCATMLVIHEVDRVELLQCKGELIVFDKFHLMQLRSIVMSYQDLAQHEDLRVKPASFHQSITASTYNSAESIATLPPESAIDNEQLRALPSPLYLQEREASVERSQVYHSERQNLMSSSSQDPTSTGKPVAMFSSQNRLNQDTFPIETIFP